MLAFGLKVLFDFIAAPTNFIVAGLLVFGSYQVGHWRGDSYRNYVWVAQIEKEKKAQDGIIQKTTNQAIAKSIELAIELEKSNDLVNILRAEAALEPNPDKRCITDNGRLRINRIGPN